MNIQKINKKLRKAYGGRFTAAGEDGALVLRGESGDWSEIVSAGLLAAKKNGKIHVVNDVRFTGAQIPPMRVPQLTDTALEGDTPDVLIVGGGISGASIARELSKWKLDILLVEKEADLALGASGRNDGEVHPGVDLGKGSLKHKYVRAGNRMYEQVCKELGVEFRRMGQYACFTDPLLRPVIGAYAFLRKHKDGIEDTKIVSGKKMRMREPNLTKDCRFAIYNPSAGCVCPYSLTIAYAENAVTNGARVSLNTAVLDMAVENGRIVSVKTNRGTLYPKLVINAAGVFAEEIAKMAGDRFYSIHPRRGTNSILDVKAGAYMHTIASVKDIHIHGKNHSKGGGILHTVHDNLLIGPDAVETWEKENYATTPESIDTVFGKQTQTMPKLSRGDIITYFTGVRAATFEEDYVIEPGRRTKNLIHCAGIQSPGLTTAPAVALDVEKMAVEMLGGAEKNPDYNPIRKPIPAVRKLPDAERDALIKENPDYGEIVCRCEEISKGEILDALRSPIPVPTLDGIKKRVRPGMGRCQGGFCSPLVTKIIAEYQNVPPYDVRKSDERSVLLFGKTK